MWGSTLVSRTQNLFLRANMGFSSFKSRTELTFKVQVLRGFVFQYLEHAPWKVYNGLTLCPKPSPCTMQFTLNQHYIENPISSTPSIKKKNLQPYIVSRLILLLCVRYLPNVAISCGCWGHLAPAPQQSRCSSRASGEAWGFQTLQVFLVNFQAALEHEFWGFVLGWGCWHLSEYITLQLMRRWIWWMHKSNQDHSGSWSICLETTSCIGEHKLSARLTTCCQMTWLQVQTPSRRALSCPWSSTFPFAIKTVPSGVKSSLEAAPLTAAQTRIINPDFCT